MKIIFLFSLFVLSNSWASECRIIGTFENRKEVETSFNLPDPDSCLKMLDKARETNFFGLVVEASELKATEALFEPETDN